MLGGKAAYPSYPLPAFYNAPKSFEDLADFIAGRVLSLLGVRHDLIEPWQG